jgi:hypothetical protein
MDNPPSVETELTDIDEGNHSPNPSTLKFQVGPQILSLHPSLNLNLNLPNLNPSLPLTLSSTLTLILILTPTLTPPSNLTLS